MTSRPATTPVLSASWSTSMSPGAFIEAVAERLLRIVTDELLALGMEITRARIEIHGPISAW